MSSTLNVLILEDRPADAELMLHELRRAGFDPVWERVDTEADYLSRLDPALDVILADYSLPQFDGVRALQLMQERGLDIPFIIVSGTIGEDVAVAAMKQGAADYLLKDRLARLGPAVAHALEQKRLRDEKQKADEALRESEAKYRTLFELASDAFLTVLPPRGEILDANEAAVQMLGYSKEEFTKLSGWEIIAPEVVEETSREWQTQVENKGYFLLETIWVRKDGSRVPVAISGRPLELEGTVLFQLIGRDITERKRAEDERKRIFDMPKMLIMIAQSDATIVRVSAGWKDILGYSPDEMVGRSFLDSIHPDDMPESRSEVENVARGKVLQYFENRYRHKDGSYRTLAWAVSVDPETGLHYGFAQDNTERKRAEEERAGLQQRLQALWEIAHMVDADYQTLCDHVLAEIVAVTQSRYGFYGFLNEDESVMTLHSWSREAMVECRIQDKPIEYPIIKAGLWGDAVRERRTLIINDYQADHPAKKGLPEGHVPLTRILAVPIFSHGRIVSLGAVANKATEYTEEDAEQINAFVTSVEAILEKRQAEEALRESEERYHLIVDGLGEIGEGLFIVDRDYRVRYMNQVMVGWFGDQTGKICYESVAGLHSQCSYCQLEAVIDRGETVGYQPTIPDGRTFDVFATAIVNSDGTISKMEIIRDITERKQAEEELRQSYVKLQRALEGTVNVLVSAIEMRDPYTAGHQQQVTQLACAIAKDMGLPEEQIEGLRMAGLIHDLGKITVPAEILSKPGRINDIEFSLIKMHPQVGHDILNGMAEFPWPVAQIVLQHHERMDGSGYPQGLSQEEILLEARILAVADVVEAMASHRPYRSALGIDQALEEISQNRGVLYAPEVVDACLKLFIEKGFTLE